MFTELQATYFATLGSCTTELSGMYQGCTPLCVMLSRIWNRNQKNIGEINLHEESSGATYVT